MNYIKKCCRFSNTNKNVKLNCLFSLAHLFSKQKIHSLGTNFSKSACPAYHWVW